MFIIFIPLRYYWRKIRLFFRRQNTSDAEEEEVHSEKLATPLAPPHYFVKTEAELFWSFFRSRHRGMSGSSICLNMLLITVHLPIYLNVSIAVSHVPSAAPLSGLPHRQIIIYMSIFLPLQVLFWSSFRSRHRGMSGSSIFLNLLLISVRLPIYLNVSIAVSHVPSAAPLSGLPHRQIIIYMSIFLPTVSMYMYFLDGSLTFRNRFEKLFQNSITPFQSNCLGVPSIVHHQTDRRFLLMALSVSASSSYRIAIQWISAVVRVHHSNPLVRAAFRTFQNDEVAFVGNCVMRSLLESVTACLNDMVFYSTISICNRYGTNVLKVFQTCNMAMQTATLPLTESNGKSKGKKFSPRRCLRLRLRENKICILPLGYAKGVIMQILNCLGPQALPQATLQGK
ncbi:hypothetical protein T05_4073 [Trichinella murrelli]|uniref:Uncharacterized protein n=1 Tax=Trichinella murrelli TaxID=144512 RepID=A0A0V0U9V9_9BILA|nr:hypothetical protein T05_4073 [Trichinella murrelli]